MPEAPTSVVAAPLFRRKQVYLVLAAGLVCLVWGAAEMWRGVAHRKRLETVDARVRVSEGVTFGPVGHRKYRAQTEVAFSASGRTYSVPLSIPELAFSREELNDQLRRYSPGSAIRILYDPANPEDIEFDTGSTLGYKMRPFALLACGLIFLSAVLLIAARDGRYQCASCGAGVAESHAFCYMCGKKIPARKGKMAT